MDGPPGLSLDAPNMQRRAMLKLGCLALTLCSSPICSTPTAASPPAKEPSRGIFVDGTGVKHAWTITATHTLQWENAPYIPVGGLFSPASLSSDSEQAWQTDQATLAELQAKGLQDMIIDPGITLVDVPATRLQRLIDALESAGFRYGLAFGKGVPNPLTGTVVKPASYKCYVGQGQVASWQTPNADTAVMVLAEASTGHNEIARISTVHLTDDNITTSIEAPPTVGPVVPYLYPHKSIPVGTRGSIPDVWTGFDTYRDRVLALFSKIKLGKGFRFFLDPLGPSLGLLGENDYLIPDSRAFQLEWESYIRTTYPNLEEAYLAWSLEEAKNLSAHDLARLIPLWTSETQIPYLYDPQTKKTYHLVEASQSAWWRDYLACRDQSLHYYMRAIANILKHRVGDVPVVFNWTMNHTLFMNNDKTGGFDGLGVFASLRGNRLINRAAVPAFSAIAQSTRNMWCLETGAMPESITEAAANGVSSPGIPFASQAALTSEMTSLRQAGLKGFFVGTYPDDAGKSGQNDWLRTPNALDWLKAAGVALGATARMAEYTPAILYYPDDAIGPAQIGPIGSTGAYWMPSFHSGSNIDWWPTLSGYTLALDSDRSTETVLVSLQGKREIHFRVSDPKLVEARTANGTLVPLKIVSRFEFSVLFPDRNPIIFTFLPEPEVTKPKSPITTPTKQKHPQPAKIELPTDQQLMPQEVGVDAVEELDQLYRFAAQKKISDADSVAINMTEAHEALSKQQYLVANAAARVGISRLLAQAAPYIWIEGEDASITTLDGKASYTGASRDSYLRISNFNNPPREYGVHYKFNVVSPGDYSLWIAATPPGPDVSPFQWALSDNQRRDPIDPNPHGPLYANDKFGWILLGTVRFDKPSEGNILAIYVVGRAPATGAYNFGIDAVYLSPSTEPPYGPFMPLPVVPSPLPRERKREH